MSTYIYMLLSAKTKLSYTVLRMRVAVHNNPSKTYRIEFVRYFCFFGYVYMKDRGYPIPPAFFSQRLHLPSLESGKRYTPPGTTILATVKESGR